MTLKGQLTLLSSIIRENPREKQNENYPGLRLSRSQVNPEIGATLSFPIRKGLPEQIELIKNVLKVFSLFTVCIREIVPP